MSRAPIELTVPESVPPLPVAPTIEAWRAMTPQQRESFLVSAIEASSHPLRMMGEGRPHKKAKTRALDMLGLHFRAMGRVVYLAEEMIVAYPGEPTFTPDLLAVVGVEEPEDDERLAWVVADEKRGLDFVLEVVHMGSREKDLVENVQRYARLGIPEYFVYDRGRQQIHGFRLSVEGESRYQRIVPQLGRYSSTVLGLDLALSGGRLRFFQGMAELFDTAELLSRLGKMVEELEARAEEASKQAEQAVLSTRETILALLGARGISSPEEVVARVKSCDDLSVLQRWLLRAATAATASEVIDS